MSYLLNSGYESEIISAINKYEGIEDETYQDAYFDYFIRCHHGESMRLRSTGKVCQTCGQMRMESQLRDYKCEGGRKRAIIDCMKSGKTKYAVPIAKEICSCRVGESKYPPKIRELLHKIKAYVER